MDPRQLIRLIAAGRIGFGVALLAAPERTTTLWFGRDAGRAGTQVAVRAVGARDLALGLGALTADQASLRSWTLGAILADTGDLVATVKGGASLPIVGRALVSLLALSAAAGGAAALAGLARGGS